MTIAIYLAPAVTLLATVVQYLVERANPEVPVGFLLLEFVVPAVLAALHLAGLAALGVHSLACLHRRRAPALSSAPAYLYYAIAVGLLLVAIGDTAPFPVIWAI